MEAAVTRSAPLTPHAAGRPRSPLLAALARPRRGGFASISAASSSGGCGGGGRFSAGGGGGGGDDPGAGAAAAAAAVAALGEAEQADGDADAIVLHVGGMSCGGCAAKVKRILETQPEVAAATVDVDKATALVWTTPEAKATKDWQKQLGERLANHLTSCGFQSHLQGVNCEAKAIFLSIHTTQPRHLSSCQVTRVRMFLPAELRRLPNCSLVLADEAQVEQTDS